MFLGTLYEKKTGRTKLKIVEGYRKEGKVKQRMVKDLGYLDELEKQFDDPIAHFKAVAKQMTARILAMVLFRCSTINWRLSIS